MVAPYNIRLGAGITFGSGIGVNTTPSGGGGDITITYSEFNYPSGGPTNPPNFQDTTTTGSGTGFTINDPTKSGVLMVGLTTPNIAFVAANLPNNVTFPFSNGEIWTANWSAGSTYTTTPVAAYYSDSAFGGLQALIFWILDPADGSYTTGAAGTFNFPVTLTAGTTTSSYFTI